MQKYDLTSFADIKDKQNICYSVIGNPATIFILDENENIVKNITELEKENKNGEQIKIKEAKFSIVDNNGTVINTPSQIAIEEHSPMACFIKNKSHNEYNVWFFNLDGSQAYMCGHGALAIASLLHREYKMGQIKLYYDTTKFELNGRKIEDNSINISVDDNGKVMIQMNMFNYSIVENYKDNEDIIKCREWLGLEEKDVECVICGKEYYDLTFILKDGLKLRTIKPDFEKLAVILAEDKMDVRNLCVSAKSVENSFDFETRVFCPHDDLNEDIACGSSNLTISRYWHNTTKKNEFKILFPYNVITDNNVGGIQFIRIEEDKIFIGGYCR
ncbi:MAG: PhzF family phenazine biosynthesis protein [Rickettsiales bacterium]|nr:PhzF family phenazine biosynthesis protein [Rickettsiales bacterium]